MTTETLVQDLRPGDIIVTPSGKKFTVGGVKLPLPGETIVTLVFLPTGYDGVPVDTVVTVERGDV